MNATYLLIDILALSFPLAFSTSARFGFGRDWPKAWAAVLLSAIPFLIWDALFTRAGVWGFNPRYILGRSLWGLPLEEIFFFVAIPFSCLFIYRQIRGTGPRDKASGPLPNSLFTLAWGIIALGLLALACLHPGNRYTWAVCLASAVLSASVAVLRPRYSPALLGAVAAQFVPFLAVNGLLTGLPVVIYNAADITGHRIGPIPVEDAIYSFALIVLPVLLFEALVPRSPRASDILHASQLSHAHVIPDRRYPSF